MIDKTKLAEQFGKAAPYYHQRAKVQQYAADRLLSWLEGQSIPLGNILELGCGTGFLSQGLVELFPEHSLEISDLSPALLQFCQAHLTLPKDQFNKVTFSVLDAETFTEDSRSHFDRYRLIASSFVLQWFQSPLTTLQSLYRCLQPGGILVLSFPSDHSFPELKTYCSDRQIPYPLNPLPDFKTIVEMLYNQGLSCEYRLEWYSEDYPNLKSALQHLKDLGAGLSTVNSRLSYRQMKALLQGEEHQPIMISHHIIFLLIRRLPT
ncbi:MAG: methyltransferase [Prochlorotrichaceae cyanobacterium]|jgi:malonyl-CoA O-methyltransferase